MQIMIVRTCDTSRGRVVCEVPGGTKDQGPYEFSDLEAENLIAAGHGRRLPAEVQVEPAPSPASEAPPVAAEPATEENP